MEAIPALLYFQRFLQLRQPYRFSALSVSSNFICQTTGLYCGEFWTKHHETNITPERKDKKVL